MYVWCELQRRTNICSAQLDYCISARATLHTLSVEVSNAGVSPVHAAAWLLASSSSTKPSRTSANDSAYHSQSTALDPNLGPQKKRKRDNANLEVLKEYECTYIDMSGNYCPQRFKDKTDWKRHEEVHWPQSIWPCLLHEGINIVPTCHVCNNWIDMNQNLQQTGHALCILAPPREKHCPNRKDKLKLHLKESHSVSAVLLDSWQQPVYSPWKHQCGFCGESFTDWNLRCSHIAQHFANGMKMIPDWKEPWTEDDFNAGGNGGDGGDDDDDFQDGHDEG